MAASPLPAAHEMQDTATKTAPSTATPVLAHPRVALLARPRAQQVGKRKAQRQEKDNALVSNLRKIPVKQVSADDRQEESTTLKLSHNPGFEMNSQAKPKMPSRVRPSADPHSSALGRFTISHKGIRKRMKRIPVDSPTAQSIASIEHEIVTWLYDDDSADIPQVRDRVIDATQVEVCEGGPLTTSIVEVSRSFRFLQWHVTKPFTRFLVHLVARLWNVVSFSKQDSCQRRLTYLLRPNAAFPDPLAVRHGPESLLTPPTTDHDLSSSGVLTEVSTSDLASDFSDETASEAWSDDSLSSYSSSSSALDRRRRRSRSTTAVPSSALHRTISLDSSDPGADVSDLASDDDALDSLAQSIEQLDVDASQESPQQTTAVPITTWTRIS